MKREYKNGIPVLTKAEWHAGLKPEDVESHVFEGWAAFGVAGIIALILWSF